MIVTAKVTDNYATFLLKSNIVQYGNWQPSISRTRLKEKWVRAYIAQLTIPEPFPDSITTSKLEPFGSCRMNSLFGYWAPIVTTGPRQPQFQFILWGGIFCLFVFRAIISPQIFLFPVSSYTFEKKNLRNIR